MALHLFGWKDDKGAFYRGVEKMKEAVLILEERIGSRSWLVGEYLTLADIFVFNSLIIPF